MSYFHKYHRAESGLSTLLCTCWMLMLSRNREPPSVVKKKEAADARVMAARCGVWGGVFTDDVLD